MIVGSVPGGEKNELSLGKFCDDWALARTNIANELDASKIFIDVW